MNAMEGGGAMIESGVLGTLRIRKYERCSVGGDGKTVYNNSTPSMSVYFAYSLFW